MKNHAEEPTPAAAGEDAEDRASSTKWVRDTLTDPGLGAMKECIRAARDAAGDHTADLSSVLGRVNELFRELGDLGAGYWQVRTRSAEASGVVFEVLLGERLPGGAGISSIVPLSSEAESGDGSAVSAIGPKRPVGRRRGREEAETGPQAADGYQGRWLSSSRERVRPDRASLTDDGRVVLIRCHATPQPEHAADDDMTILTSLCRWLHEQCHQIASGSAVEFASFMTAGHRAGLRDAELFIAYDAGNGLGAWLRRELAAGLDVAPGPRQAELHPRPDLPSVSAERGPGPEGDGRYAHHVQPARSQSADVSGDASSAPRPGHAAPGALPVGPADGSGAGTSGPEHGGASRSQEAGPSAGAGRSARGAPEWADHVRRESAPSDDHAQRGSPLAELQALKEPAARLQVLISGLRSAGSALPADPGFARMTVDEQVSRFAATSKPPEGLWIVATKPARYDTPPDETTILTVRIPPRRTHPLRGTPGKARAEHGQAAPSPASLAPYVARGRNARGPAEHRTSKVIFAVDSAVIDTLLNALLGPSGSRELGYDQLISLVKIVIQPRMLVVKVVTMTTGAFLKAHGLGLLAPASGRILTRTLVPMLNLLLGPGRRCNRLQWFLNWSEIALYAKDDRLADSPILRSKLADWTRWAWNRTAGPAPRHPGSRKQSSHDGRPSAAPDPRSDRTGPPSDSSTDRSSPTPGRAPGAQTGPTPGRPPSPPAHDRGSSGTCSPAEPPHASVLPEATPLGGADHIPAPPSQLGPARRRAVQAASGGDTASRQPAPPPGPARRRAVQPASGGDTASRQPAPPPGPARRRAVQPASGDDTASRQPAPPPGPARRRAVQPASGDDTASRQPAPPPGPARRRAVQPASGDDTASRQPAPPPGPARRRAVQPASGDDTASRQPAPPPGPARRRAVQPASGDDTASRQPMNEQEKNRLPGREDSHRHGYPGRGGR